MPTDTLYEIPITKANGELTNLSAYRGKVLLIVNVASQCGFTPQYEALERLHQTYQDKNVVVLGFPCNQFGAQEPGSNEEIIHFATSCFRVTFPLFGKIDVKGREQCPLYQYLEKHMRKKPWFFIPWNFTKILVDQQGQVLRQFLPFTSFKTIEKAINQQMNK